MRPPEACQFAASRASRCTDSAARIALAISPGFFMGFSRDSRGNRERRKQRERGALRSLARGEGEGNWTRSRGEPTRASLLRAALSHDRCEPETVPIFFLRLHPRIPRTSAAHCRYPIERRPSVCRPRTHARIVVGQPAGARSRFPAKVARRESPRDSFVSAYKRPQSTDRLLAYQRFAFAAGQFREPAPARGPIVALGCRYRR